MNVVEKVQALMKIPQYKQRSPEWFQQRHGMLTASSAAKGLLIDEDDMERSEKGVVSLLQNAKIGQSCYPYGGGKKALLISKCDPEHSFTGSDATRWGTRYEPVATLIYEKKNNTNVIEFGLLPHPTLEWLGASPDGITPDGIMLEIKCPYNREITGIPPIYYWIQVQLQLEVCDLEYCDFEECDFEEYTTEKEYLADSSAEEKGVMLVVLSSGNDDEYIYPPLVSPEKIDEWIENWAKEEVIKDPVSWMTGSKKFYKIYYKLTKYSCVRIVRDREWFAKRKPQLKSVWDEVISIRSGGQQALAELKKPSRSRSVRKVTNMFNSFVIRDADSDTDTYDSDYD